LRHPGSTLDMVSARPICASWPSRRSRELAAGNDALWPAPRRPALSANGRDLRLYGSRGQQRSAALALKLAELRAMTAATGAAPLLLLDDVMSELDASGAARCWPCIEGVPQAIVTTTDWEDFSPELRDRAQCLHVTAGAVQEVTPP
jgi:DNA replication and repair protein RecF